MGRRRCTKNLHLPPHMQLSHGSYYLTKWDGEKLKWTRLGRDFSTALQRYANLVGKKKTGRTFNDLADRFQAECFAKYSANSRRSYQSWLKPLRAVFGPVDVGDIRKVDAAQYLDQDESKKHKTSANRQISLLSTMLTQAEHWGWVDRNPLLGMKKHEEGKRERYVTDAELQGLIAAADPQMAAMIRIAHVTALRKSDIIKIQWKDVDHKEGVLRVMMKKTKTPLHFALDGQLKQVFAELQAQRKVLNPYVFLNKRHTPICDRTVDTRWWAVREKAGLDDVVFHDIRRKRITDLTKSHGIEFAQQVAGHRDRKTTERYVQDDGQIEAIELPM